VFIPWGGLPAGGDGPQFLTAFGCYLGKLVGLAMLLGVFEITEAKMRVFRAPQFVAVALMLGLLAALLRLVSRSF